MKVGVGPVPGQQVKEPEMSFWMVEDGQVPGEVHVGATVDGTDSFPLLTLSEFQGKVSCFRHPLPRQFQQLFHMNERGRISWRDS